MRITGNGSRLVRDFDSRRSDRSACRARFNPPHRTVLILVFTSLLGFTGCGGKDPTTTKSTGDSSSGQASDSSAATSPESASATSSADGTAETGATSESAGRNNPAVNAKSGASSKQSHAAAAGVAKTGTAARAKPPAAPSPEQIAKWEIPDYQPLQLLACRDGFSDSAIQMLAVSPDGKQFVVAGAKLTLWTLLDSQPSVDLLANYTGDEVERPVRSVAISPDGNWLAAGDQKGMLRIFNLSDHREVVAIRAHEGRLTQLAFGPNSQILATTSYSGEVRLWQATDGKKIKSLKVSDQEIARLVFVSDERFVAAGKETSLWNIDQGTKETDLTTGYVRGPALGLSSDRRLLAFADAEGNVQLWDVERQPALAGSALPGGAGLIEFSPDRKWIATYANDSTIRLWDAAGRRIVQVIDADGGRTADLKWLPQSQLLLVASELGRIRVWGTPESAKAVDLQPLTLPALGTISPESRKPLSPAHLQKIIDVRSFPQLPGAVPQWSQFGMIAYTAPSSRQDAELFYRYFLGKAGWKETTTTEYAAQGMEFQKEGCVLYVSLTPGPAPAAGSGEELQVSLSLAGNYDVRWLPRVSDIGSKNSWSSPALVLYRTKMDLTDVEVAVLKQFHELGWTPYSRLAASTNETPDSRTIAMRQGGSELMVTIGHPSNEPTELAVHTSVSVSNESLPVPPDAGWIEFDSSTDLQLVANTKMNLDRTVAFYDTEMAAEGWLAREAGRHIEEGTGWLPYIRGQQDVVIRLATLEDGKTRVIIGDAERSSWQLKKPASVRPETEKAGLEAAEFPIPKGARAVKFEVDQKQIEFALAGVTPPELAEQLVKELEALDWKREKSGVMSDEYVLAIFSKGKAEIQIRARAGKAKNSTVMVGGDGLLWGKPLPVVPVRISYETWLRRNRFEATLDRLDEFLSEMRKIAAEGGAGAKEG